MKKVTRTAIEIVIDAEDIEGAETLTFILPENKSGITKLEFDLKSAGLKVNNHIIHIQKNCQSEKLEEAEMTSTQKQELGKQKKLNLGEKQFKNGIYKQLGREFAVNQDADWVKRQFIAHKTWDRWEEGLLDFFAKNPKLDLSSTYKVWSVGLWLAKEPEEVKKAVGGEKTFNMLCWLFEPIMRQLKDVAGVK
ncbi:MAG: hypothetical protein K9M44_03380 [Candidatus Pacebacteria bacterium]|nr:hypothetical protein [Candidatus Paceibacterota bacterium]